MRPPVSAGAAQMRDNNAIILTHAATFRPRCRPFRCRLSWCRRRCRPILTFGVRPNGTHRVGPQQPGRNHFFELMPLSPESRGRTRALTRHRDKSNRCIAGVSGSFGVRLTWADGFPPPSCGIRSTLDHPATFDAAYSTVRYATMNRRGKLAEDIFSRVITNTAAPKFWPEFGATLKPLALVGNDANDELLNAAWDIARSELELLRIRNVRFRMINKAMSHG